MRSESERKSNIGKRLLSDESGNAEGEPTAKRMLLLNPGTGAVNQKLGLIVQQRANSNAD